jgi:hypothetical protein
VPQVSRCHGRDLENRGFSVPQDLLWISTDGRRPTTGSSLRNHSRRRGRTGSNRRSRRNHSPGSHNRGIQRNQHESRRHSRGTHRNHHNHGSHHNRGIRRSRSRAPAAHSRPCRFPCRRGGTSQDSRPPFPLRQGRSADRAGRSEFAERQRSEGWMRMRLPPVKEIAPRRQMRAEQRVWFGASVLMLASPGTSHPPCQCSSISRKILRWPHAPYKLE